LVGCDDEHDIASRFLDRGAELSTSATTEHTTSTEREHTATAKTEDTTAAAEPTGRKTSLSDTLRGHLNRKKFLKEAHGWDDETIRKFEEKKDGQGVG
jgi:hypothetical protein